MGCSRDENLNSKFAILIISYDGYHDLLYPFFELFDKYWNDCGLNIYLANNTKDFTDKNVKVINCGENAMWSDRTRISLNEINEEYVILMLEDYFLSNVFPHDLFEEIFQLIINEKIDYYKLSTFSKIKGHKYKESHLIKLSKDIEYAISLQTSIWEKKFLLNLLGDGNYSAWEFEKKMNDYDLSDDVLIIYDSRNILNIKHGVVQGHYLPGVKKFLINNGCDKKKLVRKTMPLNHFAYYKTKFLFNKILSRKLKFRLKKLLKTMGFKFIG